MATTANLLWNWVVETLANSEQVDPSILIDLVKGKPGISDDLGNNAREMVSLRILESLFLSGSDTTTDTGSSPDARIGFDTSQKCEDVLRHILNETSPSSRKNKLERSKWDVQPFLAQKRSSLTKSSLQQLKEAIIEGRHPLLASLIERSGLIGGAKSIIRNSGVSEKEICLNPGVGVNESREDVLKGNLLHAVSDKNKSATEIGKPSLVDRNILINGCDRVSNAPNPVNNLKANSVLSQMTQTIEEPSGGFLQCTQTEERNFAKEPSMNDFQGSTLPNGCDDEHVSSKNLRQSGDHNSNESNPAKKLKVDSVCMKQNVNLISVSSQETEQIDYSFRGLVQNVQTEVCGASKELRVGLEDIRLSDMLHDTQQISCNELEVPHGISAVGQCQKASPFIDGNDEKRELMSNEIQANALHGLLSSHDANTEDFLETIDTTEINLCINCSEGGQMLVCSSNACPLVIHESCLVSGATFDANQNFYCPFCAYSLAFSEFKEANRKALLARNNLNAFLGFQNKCRQKQSSEGLSGSGQNKPPSKEHLSENCGANGVGRNVNSVRLNEEDIVPAQPSIPPVNDNLSPVQKETAVTNAGNHGSIGEKIIERILLQEWEPPREVEEAEIACPVFHGCEPNACSFRDKELDRVSNRRNCGLTEEEAKGQTFLKEFEPPRGEQEEQQTAGPFIHDFEPNISSFISNEIGHVNNKSNCCLMQDKQDGQNLGQECQSPREHEETHIAGQTVNNSESNASSSICKEIRNESEKHPEVEMQLEVQVHQNITLPHETSTKKDIKREEDHEPPTSKYSTRLRKRKPQDTYTASPSPSLRRKVLPWTKLEEETLKEGVQKFSNAKDGVFPWKKILDFGGSVFQNRNVVDLKDKWRNICKGSSKPK